MPYSQPKAFPLNSQACDLASWRPLVGNVCKLHTMGKLSWDPEPGRSPGPHAPALMLCGRHLAMLNNFMSEFLLCKWSPMEHWSLQPALVCLPRPHDHPPGQLLGQLLSAHCTVGQASPSLPAPPWDHCHPYPKCPQQQTPNALQPFTPGGSLGLEVGTARGHDLSPALSWADRTTLCLADDWEKGLLHMLIQVPSMFQSGGCNPWEDTCPHKVGMLGPGQGEIHFPAPGWNLPCSFCTGSGTLHSGAGTSPISMGTCEESLAFDPLHWCPYSRRSEEGWLRATTLPDVRIQNDQHLEGYQGSKGAWSGEKPPRSALHPTPLLLPSASSPSFRSWRSAAHPSSGCSELHPFAPAQTQKHICTPRAMCTGAKTLSQKHFCQNHKGQKRLLDVRDRPDDTWALWL